MHVYACTHINNKDEHMLHRHDTCHGFFVVPSCWAVCFFWRGLPTIPPRMLMSNTARTLRLRNSTAADMHNVRTHACMLPFRLHETRRSSLCFFRGSSDHRLTFLFKSKSRGYAGIMPGLCLTQALECILSTDTALASQVCQDNA